MLNYARMFPLYLAEMESLKNDDPLLYEEFRSGTWVVNKNAMVPFCSIGADQQIHESPWWTSRNNSESSCSD